MRRRLIWIIGAGVLAVIAAVLIVVFLVLPGGEPSANAAILERMENRADADTPRILNGQEWGDGRLILAAYRTGEDLTLALGFVVSDGSGWRLAGYTEEGVKSNDVGVGSLLVASSEGGPGQPPWSVAAGHLVDTRVKRVEIRWASGDVSAAPRRKNSYLVVQRGTTTPLQARYLGDDGIEIAKVPIEGSS
jgi:hypothetical protein